LNGVHSVPLILANALLAVTIAASASPASTDAWSVGANLVIPDRSLKAHQPGPGLSLQWERPLAPHWSTTVSVGYLTLLTKRTPSYQMVPIQGGIKWVLRDQQHSPFLAADLGLFATVESFRFRFAETIVRDDQVMFYWGPGLTLGYQASCFESGVSYQVLFPSFYHLLVLRASDAGVFRIRSGYRF